MEFGSPWFTFVLGLHMSDSRFAVCPLCSFIVCSAMRSWYS